MSQSRPPRRAKLDTFTQTVVTQAELANKLTDRSLDARRLDGACANNHTYCAGFGMATGMQVNPSTGTRGFIGLGAEAKLRRPPLMGSET
jgi:hypothetical protein